MARARKLDGSYAGDDGRELFFQEDPRHLEAGRDIVATLELRAGARAAQQKAQASVRELDQAIAPCGRERHRFKQLDAKFAGLEGSGVDSAREAARDQVRSQQAETLREPLRLLDELDPPPAAPEAATSAVGSSTRQAEPAWSTKRSASGCAVPAATRAAM